LSRATPKSPSLAAIAKREDAAAALKRIICLGLLDKSRKVIKKEDRVEIPILQQLGGFDMVVQDRPSFYRKLPDLTAALQGQIPEGLLSLIPRGWFILGEVIIVKIHPLLRDYESHIGDALLRYYPRCSTVLADEGISGQLRQPVRRTIVGSRSRTTHKENGVVFHLDAREVMFSPGNLKERMRMSHLGQGEVVVDMFAGIGYFSIPMAVYSRPRKILAIELNPQSYHFLRRNIEANNVQDIVQPILGDCALETPRDIADRVLMGMVQVTNRYLETGIAAIKPGGTLHYHQTIPSRQFPEAAVEEVKDAAAAMGRRAEILKCRRVKKFSPGVVHAVIDARIDRDF
jgi:tRNA wybutosine-synthesizing protein 2